MKVVMDDYEMKVYCYHCEDCEERFFLERLVSPSIVTCPHCGDGEQVSISSEHLAELMNVQA